jgi:hypothetical protein
MVAESNGPSYNGLHAEAAGESATIAVHERLLGRNNRLQYGDRSARPEVDSVEGLIVV